MLSWLRPLSLSMLLFTWAASFIYISWNVNDWLSGLCVFFIGMITLVAGGIGFQQYQLYIQKLEHISNLRAFFSNHKDLFELSIFDEQGEAVWSTHNHRHENDIIRFLKSHMEGSAQLDTFIQNYVRRKNTSLVAMSNRDGLREKAQWHFLHARHFSSTTKQYHVFRIELDRYFSDYEKLKKSLKGMEKFVDQAPMGMFYLSPKHHITGMNTTFASWLNISKNDVLGESLESLLLKNKEFKSGLNPVTFKTNAKELVSFLVFSPKRDSFYKDPHFVFNVDSITKDHVLEQETFLYSAIPSLILNKESTIQATNPAFRQFISHINGSLNISLGKNFSELTASRYHGDISEELQKLQNTRLSRTFDIHFYGEQASARAFASYIHGDPSCILIQLVDKTDQKRLESQFIQSQKMQAVGQLAGGIAHDFNNLLTAMIGFCDLLLQRYMPSDPSYADVVQIKQNGVRAANLVRQLLAFSRQQTLQPKVLHMSEALSELNLLLRRLIGSDIELKLHHGENLGCIYVDPVQFEQIIINLVVNARDAILSRKNTASPHVLKIETFNRHLNAPLKVNDDMIPAGDFVCVKVSDTGCGISKDHLSKIFEPFFSTKGVGEGTGLGLSTVYGIVKQTGGDVVVESVEERLSLKSGTTFTIYFPRYQMNTEEADELSSSSENSLSSPIGPTAGYSGIMDLTGREHILLVEDEPAVRQFSARALREKGYNVVEADCGEEALDIINSSETLFDLIISDVVMPKMDGPTLVNRVQKTHPQIKVIFVSGYAEDTFRDNLDKTSRIHFLPKPFSLKELAQKVKTVLSEDKTV
jgi:two-component system cell cycle sensor histidine kinase/response regulator CckA